MKSIIFVLLCSTVQAKDFTFKYKLGANTLEIKVKKETWEEAFTISADKCFKHFIVQKPMSKDYGLDVIDTCANPR